MNTHQRRRLERIEAAIHPRQRKFFVMFDGGDDDPNFDREAEIQRLRDEQGMTDHDILTIVSWIA